MKIYEATFQESEEYMEAFRMFFASKKECHKWIKENYDYEDENSFFIQKLDIPTKKKDLIRFLNNHFPEGGG
tara:strand:+ start:763 stop:978 length:216 start_codon:yes stop_codon:yes gene_type:complete